MSRSTFAAELRAENAVHRTKLNAERRRKINEEVREKEKVEKNEKRYAQLCEKHDRLVARIAVTPFAELHAELYNIRNELPKLNKLNIKIADEKSAINAYQAVLEHPQATLREKLLLSDDLSYIGYWNYQSALSYINAELYKQFNARQINLNNNIEKLNFANIKSEIEKIKSERDEKRCPFRITDPAKNFKAILKNELLSPQEKIAVIDLFCEELGYRKHIKQLITLDEFLQDDYCCNYKLAEYYIIYLREKTGLYPDELQKIWPRLLRNSNESLFKVLNALCEIYDGYYHADKIINFAKEFIKSRKSEEHVVSAYEYIAKIINTRDDLKVFEKEFLDLAKHRLLEIDADPSALFKLSSKKVEDFINKGNPKSFSFWREKTPQEKIHQAIKKGDIHGACTALKGENERIVRAFSIKSRRANG